MVIYVVLSLVLLILILVIIGGGFGSKDELPSVITTMERPILFAHRGVVGNYAENTVESIKESLVKGFSAVEFDLQYSSDSLFFIHHNKKIKFIDGSTVTADEIKVNNKPISTYYGESIPFTFKIPSLLESIEPYKFKLIFYFDMKRYGHDSVFDLAKDIAEFIKEHDLEQTALVASAHIWFISYLEYTNPEIITVLEGIDTEKPWLYNLIPKKFKPDMIASRQATINDKFIQWLKDNEMLSRYIVYHGDESTFQSDLDMGIEMFIVDYKPYLDKYLKPDTSIMQKNINR